MMKALALIHTRQVLKYTTKEQQRQMSGNNCKSIYRVVTH